MERNVKLFPIYKLFSYDLLFYYAISVVFLTECKGFSLSQVALFTTVYAISAIVSQIPAAIIVDKIGAKRCMIIGNILCLGWGINLMLNKSFIPVVLGETICALGFALKGVSESPFLYASLKKLNRLNEFGKKEASGSFLYFIIEAVACAVSGYLFTINAYLPIIFACLCCVTAVILALNFNSISKTREKVPIKKYVTELTDGFKFIFKSKRLNALLLFCCAFYGVISICNILMKSYFSEHNLSATGFGYVYAIFAICAAIGSKAQGLLEKRHKNKTLTFFSITYVLMLLTAGVLSLFKFRDNILINIGIILFSIQSILKGAYRIIIKQYITRYTTSSIRSKLMSVYYLCENLGSSLFSGFASIMLASFSVGLTCTIAGFILIIIMILILEFMTNKVGLDPKTYTTQDRFDLREQEIQNNSINR